MCWGYFETPYLMLSLVSVGLRLLCSLDCPVLLAIMLDAPCRYFSEILQVHVQVNNNFKYSLYDCCSDAVSMSLGTMNSCELLKYFPFDEILVLWKIINLCCIGIFCYFSLGSHVLVTVIIIYFTIMVCDIRNFIFLHRCSEPFVCPSHHGCCQIYCLD